MNLIFYRFCQRFEYFEMFILINAICTILQSLRFKRVILYKELNQAPSGRLDFKF